MVDNMTNKLIALLLLRVRDKYLSYGGFKHI